MKLSKVGALLMAGLLPFAAVGPASAATVIFSGTGAPSVDPLGGTVTVGPNTFGFLTFSDGGFNGPITFNPSGLDNNFVATSFSLTFTYTGPSSLSFNTSFDTGLTKVVPTPPNTGAGGWNTAFNGNTVTFTAPAAINDLNPGNEFDLIVGFVPSSGFVPADFSYTATWTGTETPLPATLPLFAGGLGFVGYLTRRRKHNNKQTQTAA
jgi:hypothetical protein